VFVVVDSMQLSARTGRIQLNLIHCRFHRQSSVKVLLVQHVNWTASDPVTLLPVYNDLSPSGSVL